VGGEDPSDLTGEEVGTLKLHDPLPWIKQRAPERRKAAPAPEDQAVDQFLEKYVLYPCNQTSSPGFLEHLPCLFKEVNVGGRCALRWAVRAAAYADLSRDAGQEGRISQKALQCYGLALSAMGESLSQPGKVPDDYDLMTVVVLDVFEVGDPAKVPLSVDAAS
jgi:hypothetical protein